MVIKFQLGINGKVLLFDLFGNCNLYLIANFLVIPYPGYQTLSINMGGFSRNWQKIVKNGWFSAKIHHKGGYDSKFR